LVGRARKFLVFSSKSLPRLLMCEIGSLLRGEPDEKTQPEEHR